MRNTLAVAFLLALPAVAVAQGTPPTPPPARTPVQFIDMEGLTVHGQASHPSMAYVDARGRAKFERLLRLKRDVVGALRTSDGDPALR